jgi:hypothetical protein
MKYTGPGGMDAIRQELIPNLSRLGITEEGLDARMWPGLGLTADEYANPGEMPTDQDEAAAWATLGVQP